MRLNKKITFTIIFSLFAVSLFSSIPTGLAATPESKTGHNFEEKYWSILYDFAGEYLEKDYNVGPLNGSVTEGLTDNNTDVDSKFFMAWNNIQNVQSLYIALQNFTWGPQILLYLFMDARLINYSYNISARQGKPKYIFS